MDVRDVKVSDLMHECLVALNSDGAYPADLLTVDDILDNSDVQCGVHFCWYDYDAFERIEIAEAEARGLEVKCLYIECGELWIEVSRDE